MNTLTKQRIAVGGIAVAYLVWVWRRLKKEQAAKDGVGGLKDEYVIAKVVSTKYRNTSYYGNPSYYVTLETKDGHIWYDCYTAPNASLGYEIENGYLKREWHKYMYRDGARGCCLHNVRKLHEE